jgi:hypothetical protein
MRMEVSEGIFGWIVEDGGDDGIEIQYWEREGDVQDGEKVQKATISCQTESGQAIAEALLAVVLYRKRVEEESTLREKIEKEQKS